MGVWGGHAQSVQRTSGKLFIYEPVPKGSLHMLLTGPVFFLPGWALGSCQTISLIPAAAAVGLMINKVVAGQQVVRDGGEASLGGTQEGHG